MNQLVATIMGDDLFMGAFRFQTAREGRAEGRYTWGLVRYTITENCIIHVTWPVGAVAGAKLLAYAFRRLPDDQKGMISRVAAIEWSSHRARFTLRDNTSPLETAILKAAIFEALYKLHNLSSGNIVVEKATDGDDLYRRFAGNKLALSILEAMPLLKDGQ